MIGKQHPTDAGLMFPNEKFQEYFPDVVIPEELPEAYRSCCLRIGSYVVITYVLNEYELPSLLKKHFKDDLGLLLDLVSYLIVDEENAGQYYPDFAFCHPLFTEGMRIYSDSKVCRFLRSVTREQTIGFLDDWNRKRDHKQRIYLSYDSSNKNCQAGDIDLVEFGKAKDDKGVPVFNLAIAFDKNNRVPLFYEEYMGSITDVSQFVYMVDKVKEYGYTNIGFILDRGYFSRENIQYMEDNRYAFVIMVKGRKELVSSLIEDNLGTFETKRSCSIRAYRVYGKTVTSRLYEDDKKDRYFHIYFNPSKQAAEREHLEQTWDKMTTFLDKHLGEVLTLGKTYRHYYDLKFDKNGHLLSYKERTDVAERELNLCGYFCIITSEPMSATQALIHYKGRDISEKLFSADKSFIGSKSMRTHYGESLSAKIFIEFIALIVRNRIYNLLKEAMLRMDAKYNYMTVPAALRELEKIEMVRRNKGQYRLDHAVSKKQKVILSSFGLSDADIKGAAEDIGKKLLKNQSLLDGAQENDMEDDEDGTGTFDIFD
ncbi:MAG: transposase [Lachnospiraceae bacterium]|nr:transposase [Lachnospiraceae bacterium]